MFCLCKCMWLLAVGASALFTAPRVRVLSPPPVHAALRSTHPTALALPPTTLLPAGLLPAGLLPEAVETRLQNALADRAVLAALASTFPSNDAQLATQLRRLFAPGSSRM